MSWANAYIGIPFVDQGRDLLGCDCWGLVRLIYASECGIVLPSYAGAYLCAHESQEVAELIDAGRAAGQWQTVRDTKPFDVVVIRQGRLACHVAIAIDCQHFLNMDAADQSKIISFSDPKFARRIVGIYRHIDAALKGEL